MKDGGRRVRACSLLGAWCLTLAVGSIATAQDERNLLRDGFETPRTGWRQEKTDAQVRLFTHDRSDKAAREGTTSEHFQFEAAVGGGFYFSYALPRIPITPELRIGLQVRSDRAGAQILGRVILPKDIDPDTNLPSFVLVPGTVLAIPDRWQRLEIVETTVAVERQARILRATTKRKVSLEGAYLDRLVVNLYGGPGPTEVYLDDLRISPVGASLVEAHARRLAGVGDPAALPPLPADEAAVAGKDKDKEPKSTFGIERSGLKRAGYPWLFTVVRAPGADPVKLRRAGFDVLALPANADPADVKEAVASGLALMTEIDPGQAGDRLDVNRLKQIVDAHPERGAVAFWSIGRNLGAAGEMTPRALERDRVREAARYLRSRPEISGLTSGEVVGLFADYARVPDNLDLIGVAPFGWGTTQEPTETFKYLEQRRFLTALENTDALIYCWIPLAPSPVFKQAIWGKDRPPAWAIPRVQPDQMRLAAFTAIAAGCRGLAFDGDADLTRGAGRALLIEAALLNEELDLFEWLLADTSKAMKMLPTFRPDPPMAAPNAGGLGSNTKVKPNPEPGPHPSIRAAAFGTKDRRGTVLFVADFASAAQYQPPQMAMKDLKIDVPAPANAEAYLVSPGDVQALNHLRVPGGIRVTVPEFGPTSIVYVTTDGSRIEELQRAVVRVRPLAVNLVIEQAQLHFSSVVEIHRMLVDDGHTMPEQDELLSLASESIKSAQEAQERQDYALAWNEARRAGRPLQLLMRYQWELAAGAIGGVLNDKTLPCGPETLPGQDKPVLRVVTPVAVPPLVAFNTLPQAWVWKDWIKAGRLSANLLPSGDFEDPESLKADGWIDESYQVEGIESFLLPVKAGPGMGKYALKLSGAPIDPKALDGFTPFQDHPVAAIRTPPIAVHESEMVRIAVMVSMPTAAVPGAGGLIVRDSIGGEALEFRTAGAIPGWQEVVLYRRVPAEGELTVLLGYAGLQAAEFDNLRIQKIVSKGDAARPPVARARTTRPSR